LSVDTGQLDACLRYWGLRDPQPLPGGCRAEVFACGDVVLKLAVTGAEIEAEAAALQAWRDTGAAVTLLDVNLGLRALLLERVRPGTLMAGNDGAIAADLLSRLHAVRPGPFSFPSLAEAYPQWERQARADGAYERRSRGEPDRAAAAVALLGPARMTAAELSSTADRTVLLHGDFIGKNLLRTAHGYVAVDPLPRLGDPCADIGSFAADRPPAVSILDNAADIAGRMSLDPWRARRWAAVLAVLQTAQAWRADQAALDALMSTGELRAALTLPS
jgi:hypothetical protein